MFPLLKKDAENRVELFQIWLNLPKAKKFANPNFSMFWDNTVPILRIGDEGRGAQLRLIAGAFKEQRAPQPPPDSWASEPENDVVIWTIKMEPEAQLTLPEAAKDSLRSLYFSMGRR